MGDAWAGVMGLGVILQSERPRVYAGAGVFFRVWGGEYGEKAVP